MGYNETNPYLRNDMFNISRRFKRHQIQTVIGYLGGSLVEVCIDETITLDERNSHIKYINKQIAKMSEELEKV